MPRPDQAERLAHVRRLAARPDDDEGAVDALVGAAQDAPLEVVEAVREALLARGAPIVPRLLVLLRRNHRRNTARAALLVRLLGELGDADLVEPLVAIAVGRLEQATRPVLLRALLELGDVAVPPLERLLERSDWQRTFALEALSELGAVATPTVLARLRHWLSDPTTPRALFDAACDALGRLERDHPEVRAVLEHAPTLELGARSPRWLLGVARAGAETRFVEGALALERTRPAAVEAISHALRGLRDPAALELANPLLRRCLDERASWVVRDAICALGRCGHSSDIVRLRRFCAPGHFAMPEAIDALRELGDPGLAEHLRRVLPMCSLRELLAAANALASLGAPEPWTPLLHRAADAPPWELAPLLAALAALDAPPDALADTLVGLLRQAPPDDAVVEAVRLLARLPRPAPQAVLDALRDTWDGARTATPGRELLLEATIARVALEPALDDPALLETLATVLTHQRDTVRARLGQHLRGGLLALDLHLHARLDALARTASALAGAQLPPGAREPLAERLGTCACALAELARLLPNGRPDPRLEHTRSALGRTILALARTRLAELLPERLARELFSEGIGQDTSAAALRELTRRNASLWLLEAMRAALAGGPP